ncbi:PA0069 family radical SAM protein [Curvivirga aplysinae]|uniref:PA0069 family radical SAM protein n=1 Tax=Curvivirga aplysinae TaxID=2529852 RepID=UPI0012BB8B43|nr:PA0069 family radical SAM protein [Curvivirga aplysinae]MTI08462.1 PA0069 family radical SAM protein [Curvivirga aplysinae]
MSKYTNHSINHRFTDHALKGRGAVSNQVGRFERFNRESFDDGWNSPETDQIDDPFAAGTQIPTSLMLDSSKKIITYNQSPDVPFDRSINPYKGCEHGCVYCFARPSHNYWGLSAGLDFETKLFYKPDAVDILEKELAHPKYEPAPIAFGTNTDPYQPVEAEKKITRSLITKLTECHHPFTIVTKNQMVLRDLDILTEAAKYKLVRIMVSVTTLDHILANKLEPRATTPKKRLQTIQTLSEHNIPVGSLTAPIIPAINDHEIENLVAAVKEAGAESAGYILLRLPLEVKDLMKDWLDHHYPNKTNRVLSLISQSRDGKLNHSTFGKRMSGTGAYATMIRKRYNLAIKKHFGSHFNPEDRVELQRSLTTEYFTPPTPKGGQFNLL